MKDFKSLLQNLEEEVAPILLNGQMERFPRQGKDGIFACPWLNWRRSDAISENIHGILIMQDWWNCSNSLQDDVNYIEVT
jgi:hypothetical protein